MADLFIIPNYHLMIRKIEKRLHNIESLQLMKMVIRKPE